MAKFFLIMAALNGFLSVSIGAFGAHKLKAQLAEHLLNTYHTGVEYHFYHTMALLVTALFMVFERTHIPLVLLMSACFFLTGILFFSGSLYGLALSGPKWLGPITPIGGFCFLLGWLALLIYAFTIKIS